VLMTNTTNNVVKSRYRTDFRNTVYHCPELTYRGKND